MRFITAQVTRLLLLFTLVMQPLAMAYAMSEVDHGHHQDEAMAMSHDHEGAAMAMDDDGDSASPSGFLDDCCNSAACAPAAVIGALVAPAAVVPQHFLPLVQHWAGIDLPTEAEPPRSLLG